MLAFVGKDEIDAVTEKLFRIRGGGYAAGRDASPWLPLTDEIADPLERWISRIEHQGHADERVVEAQQRLVQSRLPSGLRVTVILDGLAQDNIIQVDEVGLHSKGPQLGCQIDEVLRWIGEISTSAGRLDIYHMKGNLGHLHEKRPVLEIEL